MSDSNLLMTVVPICPNCEIPFNSFTERDQQALGLANTFLWICQRCHFLSDGNAAPIPFEQVQCQERSHFLTIIQSLRTVETRKTLQEVCEGLRAAFATGSEVKYGWASVAPELLRELWAVMDKIGGVIPPRPTELMSKPRVSELDIQYVLQAISDVVRWCCIEGAGSSNHPAEGEQSEEDGRGGRKRGGRPTDFDPKEDRRLCQDWRAAKRQGMSRDAFARERGITVQALIDAQHREKYRRRRDAE
jgi:hypothetical protein